MRLVYSWLVAFLTLFHPKASGVASKHAGGRRLTVGSGPVDAVYVVHSKDLGPLRYGLVSLHQHCSDVGRAFVVSNRDRSVNELIESVNKELGSEWVYWVDESNYPFSIKDVKELLPSCGGKCGWYLQQFLKMYAGRVIPGIRDYVVVDADLVWFNDFKLVAETDVGGTPTSYFYNTAVQNVRMYFNQISLLTKDQVRRVHKEYSGVVHHMVFKLDVLESLLKMVEHVHGTSFWKASLNTVDPKAFSGFSEYELYFNYALEYHPTTIKLRHLTFANGPSPSLVYTHGDESRMGAPTWVSGDFRKQMAIDKKYGFDYVGYHSYAKRRYYDVPASEIEVYCTTLKVAERNAMMHRPCRQFVTIEENRRQLRRV